jgi:peptide/nickel transport system substrate-binding protein
MTTKSYWQQFERQRITRRRMLAVSGAGATGLVVVAACKSKKTTTSGTTPGTTPSGTPKAGGRYLEATDTNIDTLDPHLSVAGGPGWLIRTYNTLINQSKTKPEYILNDLALTYETPAPGGTDWIFHIRPGVKIAPNDLGIPERDMDAQDAFVAYERIKGLPAANACAFVCNQFAVHEATDPQTYKVSTPKPYAWFQLNLGTYYNTIPPRELIQTNPDRMKTAAYGGGYFFVRNGGYVEGQTLTLEQNPNYYGRDENNNNAQLPYVDGHDVKIIPDRSARRTAFLSKQSYQYAAENKAESDQLLGQYSDLYQPDTAPTNTFISVTMNVKRPPFDDPKIRKAVMHALNRQQYATLVYGGDAKPDGLVHWSTGPYALPPDELDQLQKFDPAASKQLIADAGHDVPLKITCMFPGSSTIEEHSTHLPIFLEQMAAAGFDVKQDAQDFGTWLGNYRDKNYDISLALNQIYETPENPLDFQHSHGPAGSDIYSNGLQDAEIDAAIEATKSLTDQQALVKAVQDVQRKIYDKGPVFLPLVTPFIRTLYWNFVKNVPVGLGNTGLQVARSVWLDL